MIECTYQSLKMFCKYIYNTKVNVFFCRTTFMVNSYLHNISILNINIILDRDSLTIFHQNIHKITDYQNIIQRELVSVAHYHVNGEQILTGKVCVDIFIPVLL